MSDVMTLEKTVDAPSPPRKDEAPAQRKTPLGRRLLQVFPTFLVLLALCGLAAWGHHSGWKIPRFSELNGAAKTPEDWCPEHAVPESVCVECRPDLLPKGKPFGWCKTHGVAECPLCHPEVAQLPSAPQVSAADLARAQRAKELTARPENSSKCKLHLRRLQFTSKQAIERSGIAVGTAWEARMTEAVVANGEVSFDPTGVARLSTRAPGSVWRVEKQVGQAVKQGDVLALIDAVEVGKAKSEFLQAIALLDLKSKTFEAMRLAITNGAIPEAKYREAEAGLREAQIRLLNSQLTIVNLGLPIHPDDMKGLSTDQIAQRIRFLGLPEIATATLDPRTTTANLIPVKAPLDGVVIAREVVAGEVVDMAKTLFVVADTRQMWLTLHVRQEDAKYVALGQSVRFSLDGRTEVACGTVSWISADMDEKTRTVRVRATLLNLHVQPEALAASLLSVVASPPSLDQMPWASLYLSSQEVRLRANTFGTGRIILREENVVTVPNDAVHWEGCCHVVFVLDKNFHQEGAPKVFHVRKVVPGAKDKEKTEIIAGVLPGEAVAAHGSGILRSELLKNNLGAG